MVGISLVIVGILGIVGLVVRSLSLNDTVKARFIAANLAGEGIEVVKNIIDTKVAQKTPWVDIKEYLDGLGSGPFEVDSTSDTLTPSQDRALCLIHGEYNYQSCDGGTLTSFERKIGISTSENQVVVSSMVSWTTRGNPQSLTVEDDFWNWR